MKRRKVLLCVFILFLSSFTLYSHSYPADTDIVSKLLEDNIFHKLNGFKTIKLFNRILIIPDYIDVIKAYKDNEEDEEIKFSNLIDKIKDIPYIESPTKNIFDGANCQTMTIYIQDWCEKNGIIYKVIVEPTHVYILVRINNVWKIVNYNRGLQVYDEYIG